MTDSDRITVALKLDAAAMAREVCEAMAHMMSQRKDRWPEKCAYCGTLNPTGWLLTTCENEHDKTHRVCGLCSQWPKNRVCQQNGCHSRVWDWARKADNETHWTTSWAEQ